MAANEPTAPSVLKVRVLAPLGGETFKGGSRVRIDWESDGADSHRVQVSLDGGKVYRDVASGLPGEVQSCLWTIPPTPSERARIKVVARDAEGNLGFGVSSGTFAIEEGDQTAPSVRLVSPSGDQALRGGDPVVVRWDSRDNVAVVSHSVQLSLDGGRSFNPVASQLPGDTQELRWTVPNLSTASARFRVLAVDAAGNQGEALSEVSFSIQGRPDRPPAWGAHGDQ